jgi:hypothetical protein
VWPWSSAKAGRLNIRAAETSKDFNIGLSIFRWVDFVSKNKSILLKTHPMKAFRSLTYLLFATSMILLTSCAKPNYEDAERNPAVDENGTCDAYFAQSNVCIDVIWDTPPSKETKGVFYIEFYNPDDRSQFVDLQNNLEVELWMPSMGHGSAPVKVEKTNPGQYRVSEVFFVMPGDWEIRFKLKNGATVLEQASLPYRY